VAANRRIGHRYAYLIVFGPHLGRAAAILAVLVVLGAAWVLVPHGVLALLTAGAAVVLALGYGAYQLTDSAVQGRLAARAAGERRGGLGWAVAVAMVLLLSATLVAWGGPGV
jgi:hypothetical protein